MSYKIKLLNKDLKEFYKTTNAYKKYGNEYKRFMKSLPALLIKYQDQLQINEYQILKGGRLGLLLFGYSKKYGKELVIKIIPKFLNVYEMESNAYKRLSDKYMCKIYKMDNVNNILVMEKLNTNQTLRYQDNKLEVENFFNKIYDNLTLYNKNNSKINYIEILKNNLKKINNPNLQNWEHLKLSVLNNYQTNFNNDDVYLIHGDLHSNNILKYDTDYYAIDPLGYVAPKEFTFVRFIIIELFFMNNKTEQYLDELLKFISKYNDYKKLINALYIDSVLFLSSVLLQTKKKDIDKYLPKILYIIDIISTKMLKEERK